MSQPQSPPVYPEASLSAELQARIEATVLQELQQSLRGDRKWPQEDTAEGVNGLDSQAIAQMLSLFGDKYSLSIVAALAQQGTLRFNELESHLQPISPRTLSARLKHLEEHGILTRRQYATIPPRVDYQLTEGGEDLASVLRAMTAWAQRWAV